MVEWLPVVVIVSIGVGVIIFHTLLYFVLRAVARRTISELDDELVHHMRWPTLPMFICIAFLVAIGNINHDWPDSILGPIEQAVVVLLIISVGWFFGSLVTVVEHEIYRHNKIEGEDNKSARAVRTRVIVFKRLIIGIIVLFVVAAILLTFPVVRELGLGVLASAGVFSLVIGLAASPTIENLVASVQIALSQPLRIGDIVVISGEWGTIEEITTTYVVVLIWDQRRLIVPLSKIVKESFENWSRRSLDLIGTVFIQVDYTFPVDVLRHELSTLVAASPLWDKKVCCLAVTNLKETTMELRCLVSAKNAGNCFDLRCFVREKLIDFLQMNYPQCLPQDRRREIVDSKK